jgi:NAD(P)-dependent dehydrogenase (short-subunit alcohol dehydrogenase family)
VLGRFSSLGGALPGIGRAAAERLVGLGWPVYATAPAMSGHLLTPRFIG